MGNKKEINIHVGLRIKAAREAAGLTQDKFAEMIQMGSKNLSAIERGMVGVSLATLTRICTVLNVSSDALIMGEPDSSDTDRITFLAGRLKRLKPEQFDLAMDINNKLFEVFALQRNENK